MVESTLKEALHSLGSGLIFAGAGVALFFVANSWELLKLTNRFGEDVRGAQDASRKEHEREKSSQSAVTSGRALVSAMLEVRGSMIAAAVLFIGAGALLLATDAVGHWWYGAPGLCLGFVALWMRRCLQGRHHNACTRLDVLFSQKPLPSFAEQHRDGRSMEYIVAVVYLAVALFCALVVMAALK